MNERRNKRDEKIGFSQESTAKIILQGGYEIHSDTMLGNMISMKEWEIISINDKSEYYNDKRYLLMRWLHYIYYYITNAN